MSEKDPYEAEVRRIAEVLATQHIQCSFSDATEDEKEFFITLEIPAAKEIVAAMGSVWMKCWKLSNPYLHDIADGVEYAKQQGLFPANYDPELQFPPNYKHKTTGRGTPSL